MLAMALSACEFKFMQGTNEPEKGAAEVLRYDRLESRYLTTGDFSALQQMNTQYPVQTRMLLEDMLQLGEVSDPSINSRFLNLYQDTVLQTIIADVGAQYADLSDVEQSLNTSLERLRELLPNMPIPEIYVQIGALTQSVVVGEQLVGVSLDKYLGADYPLYVRYYTPQQRKTMTRSYIVPDCLSFYLLSLYPLSVSEEHVQTARDRHMGRIQWVVNQALGTKFFRSAYVDAAAKAMRQHPRTVEEFLKQP
ncbi:MAG: gliding motility protein GldB [Prevotella sp.]|nr:gliding motility protein GldB [Prevotella sp.]MBO5615811.1 gliding motility protein GldB [Prevotella sp.]